MPVEIEIFTSPGCGKCGRAGEVLRHIAQDMGEQHIRWREVNILDELDHAVALGVLAAPAIAIDGELVFTTLPSARRLREALQDRLAQARAYR